MVSVAPARRWLAGATLFLAVLFPADVRADATETPSTATVSSVVESAAPAQFPEPGEEPVLSGQTWPVEAGQAPIPRSTLASRSLGERAPPRL